MIHDMELAKLPDDTRSLAVELEVLRRYSDKHVLTPIRELESKLAASLKDNGFLRDSRIEWFRIDNEGQEYLVIHTKSGH